MELQGKIFKVFPVESGEGKNGTWYKRTVVIETEGEYPKKVAVILWGEPAQPNYAVGANVTAKIDVESREYNGRWYTDVKAWQFKAEGSGSANNSSGSSSVLSAEKVDDSDLPF